MDFSLPNDDLEYLNYNFGEKWEGKTHNNEKGIIINDYTLPSDYNHKIIRMMILIPNNYPMSQLDMFYVSPNITKMNGKPIGALMNENHLNEQWQCWSRHYNWRPGEDNIATHFKVIENSLKEEIER